MASQPGQLTVLYGRLDASEPAKGVQQGRHAEVEYVGEVVGVLPGHEVAVGGQGHDVAERKRRAFTDVLFLRSSNPAGGGQADRLVDTRRVLDCRSIQQLADAGAQVVSVGDLRQRGEQED